MAQGANTARAPAKGHGGARWALGKRAPRARPRAPPNCPTQRNTQRDGRHMADGWLKVGRIPTRRGASTPLKMKGGREGVSAPVKRRRGAGCGGGKDKFVMAKLVGCYSHPRFVPLTPNGTRRRTKLKTRCGTAERAAAGRFRGAERPRGCRGNGGRCRKGGAGRTQSGRQGARSATERGRGARPARAPRRHCPPWGRRGTGAHDAPPDRTRTNNSHYVTPLAVNIMSYFRAKRTTSQQRNTRGVPPRRRGRCAKCRADGNAGAPARGGHADVTESQ